MKQAFLLVMLLSACSIQAQERVQAITRSFPADRFQELTILNSLGNVDVRQGGDTFEIQADIRVKAKTLDKADEVLQYVKVEVEERRNTLQLTTVSGKDFTIKKLFFGVTVEVDYHVKIPKGKRLSIANKNGSVLVGDFAGDLNVEVISGDFKAQRVEGEFTGKLKGGFFDVLEVNNFTGEFESAEVKLTGGKRLKITATNSKVEIMKAEDVIAKTTGGRFYVGRVETASVNASGTRCELQGIAESLRADVRMGSLAVHAIDHFFSSVDITGAGTKVALTFRPGGGFSLNFKHNNIKVELPRDYALETKPTIAKRVVIDTGFIGDKQFNSQVTLNLMGGSLVVQ
jgi:hypothetical protein